MHYILLHFFTDNRHGSWDWKRVGTSLCISGCNGGMLGFEWRIKSGDVESDKEDGSNYSLRVSVRIVLFSTAL